MTDATDMVFFVFGCLLAYATVKAWNWLMDWRYRRWAHKQHLAVMRQIAEAMARAARYGGVDGVFDEGPIVPGSILERVEKAKRRAARARLDPALVDAEINELLGPVKENGNR